MITKEVKQKWVEKRSHQIALLHAVRELIHASATKGLGDCPLELFVDAQRRVTQIIDTLTKQNENDKRRK